MFKNIFLAVMVCYILGTTLRAVDFSLPPNIMINNLLFAIGATPIVAGFAHLFCQSAIFPAVLLIFLSVVFLHFYKKDFFYIENRFDSRGKKNPFIRANTRPITGNSLRSFLRRDLSYVFSNKEFIVLQILFLFVGFIILTKAEDITLSFNLIFFTFTCWLNSLYVQELFAIDSKFSMWYKMLPLKFSSFIFARLVCTLIYSFVVPLILLVVELYFNGLSLFDFTVSIVAVSLIILIFGLFESCIILFFFPSAKKATDLQLLIGNIMLIVPLAPFVVIFLGLKKGNSRWREW
jgi:hypothetical protein